MVEILLEHNANVRKPVRGQTPIEYAIMRTQNSKIVNMLMNKLRSDRREVVDLTVRGLEYLPSCVAELSQVELKLEGNPLSFVPSVIKSQGGGEVLNYLREMERTGKAKWNRYKMLMIGDSEKALARALQGDESTSHGLASDGFAFEGVDLTYLELIHRIEAFNHLFISDQCVCVICFDLNEDLRYLESCFTFISL